MKEDKAGEVSFHVEVAKVHVFVFVIKEEDKG